MVRGAFSLPRHIQRQDTDSIPRLECSLDHTWPDSARRTGYKDGFHGKIRKVHRERYRLRGFRRRRKFSPPASPGPEISQRADEEGLRRISDLWDAKIFADLARQLIFDFGVPWNGGTQVSTWVAPPRMAPAFSNQCTTMASQMLEKRITLHTVTSSSV